MYDECSLKKPRLGHRLASQKAILSDDMLRYMPLLGVPITVNAWPIKKIKNDETSTDCPMTKYRIFQKINSTRLLDTNSQEIIIYENFCELHGCE